MGLNENEQRMLEEFERELYREDPRFAASFGASRFDRPRGRFAPLMAILLLLGVLAIGAGVSMQLPILGIAGFVVALFALYGLLEAALGNKQRKPSAKAKKSGNWSNRAAERFDQRRDEQP